MDDFYQNSSPAINSKLVSILEDLTKNDNSVPSLSSFQSISENTSSHPEDIPTILSTVWNNLKLAAKEWRKINKTLMLSISLVRLGNNSIIDEFKKKSSVFKELMEFFYIENRLDKGGVVRDKARILYFMLVTAGFVEEERSSEKRTERHQTTSWGHEPTQSKKMEVPKRQQEVKKVNVFEGINVKGTPNIFEAKKSAPQTDLLSDFNSTPSSDTKKQEKPDLLMLSETPQPASLPDLLLDLPITSFPGPSFEAPSNAFDKIAKVEMIKPEEKIEKKPEPKVAFNMAGQGIPINLLKANPSLNPAPAPKQPSPPKSLESRLLNLDGLTDSLTVEKPKPAQRSYY